MAVEADQHVVVVALGVFAPRQRARGEVAVPGRDAIVVAPLAGAAVAMRVADLVHALGPGAAGLRRRNCMKGPGLVGAELEGLGRFKTPGRAPVMMRVGLGEEMV